MIEALWDHRPDAVDPLVVRVFLEALRLLRRAPHAEAALADERAEQEAFSWQMSRLAALEPVLDRLPATRPPRLLAPRLPQAAGAEQRDILLALNDLRAEAGRGRAAAARRAALPPRRAGRRRCLTWSRDPRVGPRPARAGSPAACRWIRRAQARRGPAPPRRPSVPADVPYRAILRALRGHPSPETEAFLLLAARDWDPTYRAAAVSSLGWWEPFHRGRRAAALQDARRDPNPEVRQAARAALARLGERQALQWFRQTLTSEDPQRVHEAIQLVAAEGLTLLWPDLDRLADAEDADVAHHAREALERLREDMDLRRN